MKRKAKSGGLHWRPADEREPEGMHFWNADGEDGSGFWIGQPEPGGFRVFQPWTVTTTTSASPLMRLPKARPAGTAVNADTRFC
jgi:hypothetical protein